MYLLKLFWSGTFVWNGVSKTSSSGFPQKCHVLKVSFSAAVDDQKSGDHEAITHHEQEFGLTPSGT